MLLIYQLWNHSEIIAITAAMAAAARVKLELSFAEVDTFNDSGENSKAIQKVFDTQLTCHYLSELAKEIIIQ